MHHPIQPLAKDEHGTIRFKENKIVRYLLDKGGIDLNQIACMDFSKEDRQQFAQLIGYSLSGYGELSYVDDVAYSAAHTKSESDLSDSEARLQYYEEVISELRKRLKEPMAILFEKHPDNFEV